MFDNAAYVPYVFAAGRGLKDRKALSLLQLLADRLNAEVAATRGAVEEGLLDEDLMIGMSGKRIYTDLYLSIGVSGSNFHTAGVKGKPYIIAVNTDPHCRMFKLADYCVCEDAQTALQRLADYLDVLPEDINMGSMETMIHVLIKGLT